MGAILLKDVSIRRARAQWLAERPGADVAAVAGHLVGLQAQDTAAARLGVRARIIAGLIGEAPPDPPPWVEAVRIT